MSVSEIIEDARSRQADLEARIGTIKARNSALEKEIEQGVDEIVKLEATLAVLYLIAKIAFLVAIAFFCYLLWREHRSDIDTWPGRARWRSCSPPWCTRRGR